MRLNETIRVGRAGVVSCIVAALVGCAGIVGTQPAARAASVTIDAPNDFSDCAPLTPPAPIVTEGSRRLTYGKVGGRPGPVFPEGRLFVDAEARQWHWPWESFGPYTPGGRIWVGAFDPCEQRWYQANGRITPDGFLSGIFFLEIGIPPSCRVRNLRVDALDVEAGEFAQTLRDIPFFYNGGLNCAPDLAVTGVPSGQAQVSGTGYTPGGLVHVAVVDDDARRTFPSVGVTADGDGSFTVATTRIPPSAFGHHLRAKAYDATNGARSLWVGFVTRFTPDPELSKVVHPPVPVGRHFQVTPGAGGIGAVLGAASIDPCPAPPGAGRWVAEVSFATSTGGTWLRSAWADVDGVGQWVSTDLRLTTNEHGSAQVDARCFDAAGKVTDEVLYEPEPFEVL